MSDCPTALVFDDASGPPDVYLSPLTDLRASFLVRTGALTTLDRHQQDLRFRVAGVLVPQASAELTREQCRLPVNEPPTDVDSVLLINGRCPIIPDAAVALRIGESLADEGGIIASRVPPGAVRDLHFPKAGGSRAGTRRVLLTRPWHVRTFRDACITLDLELLRESITSVGTRAPAPGVTMGDRAVTIHHTANICPGVILDAEHGPIVVDDGATLRPGAILVGPCYVGPHSSVLERATIRANSVIGPHCKVNGEVGGTIFQGYANKSHDGYLGDSYVGEWVNLGAGTTNSNLLNTYEETLARPAPDAKHERTGEQFLGAVIGDHVKTAICTRIMTASVLGAGSMFATTAPVSGAVAPFTWATDAGVKPYRMEKFLEVMAAAMARRRIVPTIAYLARIKALALVR